MAGMMVLKRSTARMVTISSWAAAMASGEGVCARAGPANKQTIRQTVSIHGCLRMTSLLSADVAGSYLIAAATGPATDGPAHDRQSTARPMSLISLP